MAPPIPLRPWREIARELALETDRERIFELSQELTKAMDEQQKKPEPPSL